MWFICKCLIKTLEYRLCMLLRDTHEPWGCTRLSEIGFLATRSPSGIAKGGQPFVGARGVPAKPLFLVFLAAGGGER